MAETTATTTEATGGTAAGAAATPDLSKAADGLVAKHGDPTAALLVLLGENYKARDTVRELKAKLPADGALVLSADDAKVWARYRAAGDPKTVETALTERDAYRTEADGFKREKLHAAVAAAAGFTPAVLTRLATADGLDLAVRDVKGKDGKPAPTAVVLGKDEHDTETVTPLADYAAKYWAEFLPALKPAAALKPAGGTPQHRLDSPPRPRIADQDGTPRTRRRAIGF